MFRMRRMALVLASPHMEKDKLWMYVYVTAIV